MSIRLFGSDGPLPEQYTLQAGPITLIFEQGALRRIRYRQREVIRNIYVALRDQNWNTIPFRLNIITFDVDEQSFFIQYEAIHYLGDQAVFRWEATLTGQQTGDIDFMILGEALQPFWRNRAGFCVLHPIAECAGQPVTITEPTGRQTTWVFPETISPESPFPCIRAMSWSITDNVSASIRMEGDDFETEDQRNWSDTSYKTFCTPLTLPKPVELRPGRAVQQRIHLTFNGLPNTSETKKPINAITIASSPELLPLPSIGTLEPFAWDNLTGAVVAQLRLLHLNHYRADVPMYQAEWPIALSQAIHNAEQIGSPLLLALTFSEHATEELTHLLAYLKENPYPIQSILLFQQRTYATPTSLIQQLVEPLQKALPSVQIGAGSQTNYAEFGRNVFDADGLDFVAYSIQPQAHAFDLNTLVENMEAQAYSVFSAKTLYPNQEVYVSPLTLLSRFNPSARYESDRWIELSIEQQTDTRQFSYFGAGWALGSLKTLAEAGARSVTLFRAAGPAGLVAHDGTPSATVQVIAWIREVSGGVIRPTQPSDKLSVSTLLVEQAGNRRWLVANHTAQPIQVQLPDSGPFRIQKLAGEPSTVNSSILEIGAFEVICADT